MAHTISVLTTLYNHEKYIQEAITSAVSQTRPPDEIIVIDDGSSDRSVPVAQKCGNKTVRILAEERNLGGPNTVKGLQQCGGSLIAILNSDDSWQKEKLEQQLRYLERNPGCGAVFTLVNVIDEDGKLWAEGSNPYQSIFQVNNNDRYGWLRQFFYYGNALCVSSALIRRECFDRVGWLDGRYVQLQDLDLWIRIVKAGYDIHVIQKRLTSYRVLRSGKNMSAGVEDTKALYAFEFSKVLRNYWAISSLGELAGIFPDIEIAAGADETLLKFYLAIHSSKQPGVHHQLFALESMSSWGGNYEAMSMAAKCHNFSHADYRRFLSRGPVREIMRRGVKNRLDTIARLIFPGRHYQRLKAIYLASRGTR